MNTRTAGALVLSILSAGVCAAQTDELASQSDAARRAFAAGDYERAATMYRRLVRELPGNPGLLLNLGMALQYEGHYEDAVSQLKAALQLKPDLTPAKFFLGISYSKLHRPELAVTPLHDAADADPSNKLAQFEYADALLATERYEEAAARFERVVDLDRTDARGWQGLGLSYVGLSQQCFRKLQSASPESPYVQLLLANSALSQGRYRNAYALYRAAQRKGAGLHEVHAGLAEVYRKTEHPDWAATEEKRAVETPAVDCKTSPSACGYEEGQYAKARSYEALALGAFKKLSEMPPTPQIHELLAEAFRVRGQTHEAAQELHDALELEPKNARLQALYATALWRDHNYAEALPKLEQLVQADQDSAELTFELGDTLLEEDQAEKAVPLLTKAVKLNPRLLAAQASLGKAYMQTGRVADAVPHLRSALSADDDGSIRFQLARAYERTGHQDLAARMREQFAAIEKRRSGSKAADTQGEIEAP